MRRWTKQQAEILMSIKELKTEPTEADLEVSFNLTFEEVTEPYFTQDLQEQTEFFEGNKYSRYAQKLMRKK